MRRSAAAWGRRHTRAAYADVVSEYAALGWDGPREGRPPAVGPGYFGSRLKTAFDQK